MSLQGAGVQERIKAQDWAGAPYTPHRHLFQPTLFQQWAWGRNKASFWIQQGKRWHPEGMQATPLFPQSYWTVFAEVISACFFHALGFTCHANTNFKTRERGRLQNSVTTEIFTKWHPVFGDLWFKPKTHYLAVLHTITHIVLFITGNTIDPCLLPGSAFIWK